MSEVIPKIIQAGLDYLIQIKSQDPYNWQTCKKFQIVRHQNKGGSGENNQIFWRLRAFSCDSDNQSANTGRTG